MAPGGPTRLVTDPVPSGHFPYMGFLPNPPKRIFWGSCDGNLEGVSQVWMCCEMNHLNSWRLNT